MAELAAELTKLLNGKEIKISAISSYEDQTSPKYEVLVAIKNFFSTYDPSFTLEDIMEKNLEEEGYRLPLDKVNKKLEEVAVEDVDKIKKMELEIEELKRNVSSLIRIIEKIQL